MTVRAHAENDDRQPLSDLTIWLDSRNIGRSGGTGVATYVQGVQTCLTHMGFHVQYLWDHDPDDASTQPNSSWQRIVRFLKACLPARLISRRQGDTTGGSYPYISDIYRVAHIHFQIWKRLLWLHGQQPPDIMFWTYPLPILVKNTINIVTVHDLIPITHPHLTGINPRRLQRLLSQLVTQADILVTVSETVRQQIIEIFGISASRVVNLYQLAGVTATERQQLTTAPVVAPEGCFICVGRVERRKNIERLVEAHARSGTERPLVLLGPDGDDMPDLSPRAPHQQVIRVPWCSRESLLRSLVNAHALVFPSLAEGFGLPIVEAMALGVPVMTSRGGATEEIAGGAALLVDPYDVQDIADVIGRLDRMQPGTPQWEALRQGGMKRAEVFTEAAQIGRLRAFHTHLCELFPNRL
ncbi:glycosyltransferase family 4 protein [Komagataeibacter oboediens]|uniref:glycosyltransferase family 4 protein n=1 Tax=Komagataeibacter oboediens TaxID=65958 RepID=UPI00200F291E|nr:glycosyltransferase family 1 protein [Komagataeibacter oboediens]MCK9819836.1 glycosyltransferase family 4 protein [Komagataeibacter oboediens]